MTDPVKETKRVKKRGYMWKVIIYESGNESWTREEKINPNY